MAGRYTTVTATLYLSDGSPAALSPVTQTLQSPYTTGGNNRLLVYEVSGDSNNGEVLLTLPRPLTTNSSGVLTMHLTAPLDMVATDATGSVAANAYYLISLPDGRTIKTTTFAYSATPLDITAIDSASGATAYTTAPVTFDVDTSDEVGAPITVNAHLSVDGAINGVVIRAVHSFPVRLDASGHGTLNLPPNLNTIGGQQITPSNTFYWVTLGNSSTAYPITVTEAGGAFTNLLAPPLPQGELGAWVAGTQRGVWSSGANYNINDFVTYGGSTWYAKLASTNVTPVAGATWGVLAAAGSVGATGPAGAAGAAGATGATGAAGTNGVPTSIVAYATLTAYAQFAGVTYNGATYMALVAIPNTNTTAPTNGATWRLLAAAGATGSTGAAGPTGATGSGTTLAIGANGSVAGTEPQLNLIAGAGVTIAAADNGGATRVDVTITAAGSGVSSPVTPTWRLDFTTASNQTNGTATIVTGVNGVGGTPGLVTIREANSSGAILFNQVVNPGDHIGLNSPVTGGVYVVAAAATSFNVCGA